MVHTRCTNDESAVRGMAEVMSIRVGVGDEDGLKTRINTSEGERWFCTEGEARASVSVQTVSFGFEGAD